MGQEVVVHGWFYSLDNGMLKDLSMTVSGPEEVNSAYEQALGVVRARYDAQSPAAP